jgi:flagellar motor switch protein FliN/FliY
MMQKEEEAKMEVEAKVEAEAPAQAEETAEKSVPAKKDAPPPGTPQKGDTGTVNNFEFVLDIPLEVTVELGRARMIINDLLQLGQGSVIELNKLAGEPMEILVNHKLIARGEVVVVNEKFGVRLTDIVSPMERVERLR